jgi:hypothetical protein
MIDSVLAERILQVGVLLGMYISVFVLMTISFLVSVEERNKLLKFLTKIKKHQEFEEYKEQTKMKLRFK